MKIKPNYVLKTIGDNIVVVPVKEEALRFNGIITLNKTGQFLFETLQKEALSKAQILTKVLDKYDVEENQAKKDVDSFIEKCLENNLIDEKSL
jgi:hypothetical protein